MPAWQYLYGGSATYLKVPLDARLEPLATRWVGHEYEHVRKQGEALLKRLKDVTKEARNGAATDQAAVPQAARDNVASPAEPKRVLHEVGLFAEEILAPATRPEPAEEKGLVLEVEYDRREYLLGEPILVRCSLANYSREPITIVFGRYEDRSTIAFDLDKRIRRVERARDSLGPVPKTIPVGWRLVESYNLLDEYQIWETGEYTATVQYESDGRWARGEGHWKGKLTQSLGAMKIVAPTRPTDKAALEWLLVNDPNGRREGHYDHLFHALDRARFATFLERHGDSRYAAYARYGDGLGVLRVAKSSPRELSRQSIEILIGIDPKDYPPLFAERRLFHLIEAHRMIATKPGEIKELVGEFTRQYPHSPFASFVNGKDP
jgi:hypothetical protein